MAKQKKSLNEQAVEIIRLAEESGVQTNFFFLTTFKRYQVQLHILEELAVEIDQREMLVPKEYVKGHKNLYENPAVRAYNKTADSANKTVATLMKILKNYGVDEKGEDEDPLLALIQGGDDN